MATPEYVEFTDTNHRDPRVKGSGRLLVISHGSVVTRLEIRGEAIDGTGLFTMSDVTVPTPTFEQFKAVILAGAK